MWENIFRKMRECKISLIFRRNRNNRDDEIAECTIVMKNMNVSFTCGIAVKFFIMANAVDFLYYCRSKKNCKKEN